MYRKYIYVLVAGCWAENCIKIPKQLEYDCGVSFACKRFYFRWYFWVNKNKFSMKNETKNNSEALMDWKKRRIRVRKHKEYACTTTTKTRKERGKKDHPKMVERQQKNVVEGFLFNTLKWVFSEWVFIFLVFPTNIFFLFSRNKRRRKNKSKTVKTLLALKLRETQKFTPSLQELWYFLVPLHFKHCRL